NSISWIPNSNGGTPDKYTIKKDNAIVVGPASWTSGVPITYSVDGLPVGTYTYLIEVSNTNGNKAPDTVVVSITIPNDPPVVQPVAKLSGECNPGQAITIGCAATDPDQQSSTLSTKAWLGTCAVGNCFDTRSWDYINGTSIAWNAASQSFTATYTIPSNAQPGTGIASTCQATDDKNAVSNWGDAYPLCTVACPTLTFSNIAANPNPAWNEDVTITFRSSAVLTGNPTVTVKETGQTTVRQAAYVSNSGNNYVYRYTVRSNDNEGFYDMAVSGTTGTGCPGSSNGQLTVSKTANDVSTDPYCNGGYCSSKYKDETNVTLSCKPSSKCDKTYYSTGSGFVQYTSPFTVKKCGTTTIQYYSTNTKGYTEPIKYIAVDITCDSFYMVPSITFSNPSVIKGENTQAIFSCNIMSGSSEYNSNLPSGRACKFDCLRIRRAQFSVFGVHGH
ncbi:hypothetical protein HYZ41_03125, partial [archaeon]|nr:hypothetical protein [archaeon]